MIWLVLILGAVFLVSGITGLRVIAFVFLGVVGWAIVLLLQQVNGPPPCPGAAWCADPPWLVKARQAVAEPPKPAPPPAPSGPPIIYDPNAPHPWKSPWNEDPMWERNRAPQAAWDIEDTSGAWQPMKPASARAERLLQRFHDAVGVEQP